MCHALAIRPGVNPTLIAVSIMFGPLALGWVEASMEVLTSMRDTIDIMSK